LVDTNWYIPLNNNNFNIQSLVKQENTETVPIMMGRRISVENRHKLSAVLLALWMLVANAEEIGEWKDGRATFYGLDGWSIHKGSCGLQYQWPDIYPGFDVAAISDASSEFADSCGRCYEVKCREADFTDGYGKEIKRKTACLDPSKTVVVRTVDNCPCQYPGNQYSNSRWCCQDKDAGSAHMDLSIWAFEKLASKNLGVIATSFRRVPCDYRSANPAVSSSPSPPELPWDGAKRPTDKIFVERFDDSGSKQGAVQAVDDPSKFTDRKVVPVDKLYRDGSLGGAVNE